MHRYETGGSEKLKSDVGAQLQTSESTDERQQELRDESSTNSVTSTSKRPSAAAPSSSGDDGMITVRAHNKKTGEITVMRVKRGTPMREVMASYASNKGVKAERLSWKRRSSAASNSSPTSRDGSVVVGEKRLDEDGGDECGLPACGCTGFS